jgi:uncharacterized protein
MVEEDLAKVGLTRRNVEAVSSRQTGEEGGNNNHSSFRGDAGLSALLISVLVAVAPATTGAASFSCEKASSRIEKMICANEDLSAADEVLSSLFHALLSACDDKAKLRREQLAWLAERDRCSDVACFSTAYEGRIQAMRENLQALVTDANKAFATVRYCAEDEVFADSDRGPEDPLGQTLVCFTVHSSDQIVLVDFFVRFPDSPQRLWVDWIPAKVNKAGDLAFQFIDGWGNRGKGVFKKNKSGHMLNLEMVKLRDEGDPVASNVGRLYGEHLVKLGDCPNCLDPDGERIRSLGEYLQKSLKSK